MFSGRLVRKFNDLLLSSRRSFSARYDFDRNIPDTAPRKKMNLFQAVNDAMDIALATDKTYLAKRFLEQKYSVRTSSLAVCSDAQQDFAINTVLIEFSTLPSHSRE
jgi:hypothetical protein